MVRLTPRPYQRELIDNVREVWDLGHRNALVVAATGTGKTVLFAHLVRELLAELGEHAKAMILAHRKELLTQARQKYLDVDPDELVGIYRAERRETWARVICGSIQSCSPRRIGDLPLSQIKILIIDECHHALAPTYLAFIDAVRAASPDCLLLGVTATPFRADGKSLGALWNTRLADIRKGSGKPDTVGVLAGKVTLADAVAMGYLVEPRAIRCDIDVDFATVKVSQSSHDFVEGSLASAMDTEAVRVKIVERWKHHAGPGTYRGDPRGRPTVAFSPGVEAAVNLAAAFREAGVSAEALDGGMSTRDRDAVLERYQRGETLVLCNCQVLTEGWDAPHTACVLVGRPTQSDALLAQMVGRGTRLLGTSLAESRAGGKEDCLVLAFAGLHGESLARVEDIDDATRVPGVDPDPSPADDLRQILDDDPGILEQLALEGVEATSRQAVVRGITEYAVDLFGGRNGVAWTLINGAKVSCIDAGIAAVIYPLADGTFSAVAMRGSRYMMLAERLSELEATKRASAFALAHGNPSYLNPGPYWTRKQASEKQRRKLREMLHANQRMDAEMGGARALNVSALPAEDKISMALIMDWIAYLHCRVALGRRQAQRVGDLFTREERVVKLARAR